MPHRIAQVSSVHRATDVRIFEKVAQSLAAAGAEVRCFAYASEGEARGEIVVHGVRISRFDRKTRGRLGRVLIDTPRLLRIALRTRPDVVHVHDPELLPYAVLFRFFTRRTRFIYDAHEDLGAQVQTKPWIAPSLRPALGRLCDLALRWLGQRVDGVVAVNADIAAKLRTTVTVRNFPRRDRWDGVADLPRTPSPRFVYIGALTRARGAVTMAKAVERLRDRWPDVTLALAGPWEDASLKAEVLGNYPAVRDAGYLSAEQLPAFVAAATAGLAVLEPTPSYLSAVPTKLYEYMSAGLPFVASDFPIWRQGIGHTQCALFVDPTDDAAIANALARLVDEPVLREQLAANGLAAAHRFSWESEFEGLRSLYRRLGESNAT